MHVKDHVKFGTGLRRPESVICTASGDVFASDCDGVASHITPDGVVLPIGRRPQGVDFMPNGLCLIEDGSILVANIGADGGVWRLWPDQTVTPFVMEIDGRPLSPANSLSADARGRYWISVSTRASARFDAFNRNLCDGYLVLVDGGHARIVAEGLHFTNESRISQDGRYIYVNETAGRRLTRFRIEENGDLVDRRTVTEFGPGSLPDGCEIDEEGHIWIACIVSNRLIRVSPDGRQQIMLEDTTEACLSRLEQALATGVLERSHLVDDAGQHVKSLTSLAFGGPDRQTIYLGSLVMSSLATFRSPVAGRVPLHWNYRRPRPTA